MASCKIVKIILKNKMSAKEVILYHGSLEELNSRADGTYVFAKDQFYFNKTNGQIGASSTALLKSRIKDAGYSGLVNCVLLELVLFFLLSTGLSVPFQLPVHTKT